MDSVLDQLRHAEPEEENSSPFGVFFSPTGRYFPKDHESTVYQKYCELVDTENNLCLGERVDDYSTIVILGKLIFDEFPDEFADTTIETLTDILKLKPFILHLIAVYQGIMIKYLDDLPTGNLLESQLLALVSMPQGFQRIQVGNEIKQIIRFRFQFPHVTVDTQTREALRHKVINALKFHNYTKYLGTELSSFQDGKNWANILEQIPVGEHIPLYGSTRHPEEIPLKHDGAYTIMTKESVEVEDWSFIEAEDIFKPTSFSIPLQLPPDSNIFPLLYSLQYYKRRSQPKAELLKKDHKARNPRSSISDTRWDQVKLFVQMISVERARCMSDWLHIGQAIYHEALKIRKVSEGLRIWKDFTQKCKIRELEECDFHYHDSYCDYRSRLTLAYYAMQDSPEEYRKWHTGWCNEALLEATKIPLEGYVSMAFYRCFWDRFIYDGNNKWYYFNGNCWVDKGDMTIQEALTDRKVGLYGKFMDLDNALNLELRDLGNDAAGRERQKVINQQKLNILKIYEILTNPSKLEVLKKGCQGSHCFFVRDIHNILDNNHFIMGCEDCVIDTSGNQAVLRRTMPEDFITMSTGHCMLSGVELSWTSPMIHKVLVWMEQLFPNEEIRKSAWIYMTSLLRGGNSEKKIPILTGPRNAGKSVFTSILTETLGKYAGYCPIGVITEAANSQNATPYQMLFKTCNVVFITETKPGGKGGIYSLDKLKEYSGGGHEKTAGRDLYGKASDGLNFRQRQVLTIVANEPPEIPMDADEASRDRLSFHILFQSTFTTDAPEDPIEQKRQKRFPNDKTFETQTKMIARALLWILVQKFEDYVHSKHGYVCAEECQKAAKEYIEKYDIYMDFVKSKLERQKENLQEPYQLIFAEAWEEFTKWFKKMRPGRKHPDYTEFKTKMQDPFKLNQLTEDDKWFGWRLRE